MHRPPEQESTSEDAVADAWQLIVSDATDEVSSQIGVAGTVQDEDFVLSEGLIQALESGMKPTDMSMIHLEKSSRPVDATELQSEGSLVLGDFPDKNNETDFIARTAPSTIDARDVAGYARSCTFFF
jgi:hypothetical protein